MGIHYTIFLTLMYVWKFSFIKLPNKKKNPCSFHYNHNFQSWVCLRIHILCRIPIFIPQNSDFVCLGMGPDSVFTQSSSESDTIYRLISENYTYTTVPQIFKYIPNLKGKALSYLIPPLQALLHSNLLISYPFPETINSMKAEPVFVFYSTWCSQCLWECIQNKVLLNE